MFDILINAAGVAFYFATSLVLLFAQWRFYSASTLNVTRIVLIACVLATWLKGLYILSTTWLVFDTTNVFVAISPGEVVMPAILLFAAIKIVDYKGRLTYGDFAIS